MHSQNVDALERDGQVFGSLVALGGQNVTLVGRDAAERVQVIYRTAGWASTLFDPARRRPGLLGG